VSEACPRRRLPGSWPNKGAIVAESLIVRYRPELDPVLNSLSFSISGGHDALPCNLSLSNRP